MLLNNENLPVMPVNRYLKNLDNTGKSRNTLKTYCYNLRLYFEFLEEIGKKHYEVTFDNLAEFVGWLRAPFKSSSVIPLTSAAPRRKENTINNIINTVTGFYDYLYRNEKLNKDLTENFMKHIHAGTRRYKDFLHHVKQDKPINKNILKIKEPRNKNINRLTQKQVEQVYKACFNIRDKFLIKLLFETGLRIGEVLALFIEDIVFDHLNGHKIRLKDRGELSNGGKLKTGEREINISQELMDLFDDYMYEIIEELDTDTNFLFVKLTGKNKGNPLEYQDVDSLMKRLKRKTGINIHPHLLRHTHLTLFYLQTRNIKATQERAGHAQIQTTMEMYLHLLNEDLRKEWEKAQGVFKFNN